MKKIDMIAKDFVVGRMQSFVDGGACAYEDVFAGTLPEQSSNPYGKRAFALFHGFALEQSVFFEIVRQVIVDAGLNMLAIIGGIGFIKRTTGD